MAGTETGVELADQLSELLGLRSNGTSLSEERRNKYAMGEAVRRAGTYKFVAILVSFLRLIITEIFFILA